MRWRLESERNRIAHLGGIAVHPAFRGRRVADDAARLLQRHLIGELGLHRLQLEVYGFNERAMRHAERSGFVREGVKRKAYLRDGEWVDSVLYGLVAEDLQPRNESSSARLRDRVAAKAVDLLVLVANRDEAGVPEDRQVVMGRRLRDSELDRRLREPQRALGEPTEQPRAAPRRRAPCRGARARRATSRPPSARAGSGSRRSSRSCAPRGSPMAASTSSERRRASALPARASTGSRSWRARPSARASA